MSTALKSLSVGIQYRRQSNFITYQPFDGIVFAADPDTGFINGISFTETCGVRPVEYNINFKDVVRIRINLR